jgi:hypothetical protein
MIKAHRALFPIMEGTVEVDFLAVIITAASSGVVEEGESMAGAEGVDVKAVPETCGSVGREGSIVRDDGTNYVVLLF